MTDLQPTVLRGVEFVTTAEAAEILGAHVSVDMVQDWVRRGLLKPSGRHPGRSYVYRLVDVLAADREIRQNATRPRGGASLQRPGHTVHTDLDTDAAVDSAQNPADLCTVIDTTGEMCGLALLPGTPMSICQRHLRDAFDHYQGVMSARIRAGKRTSERLLDAVIHRPSFVYYIRLVDRVKIGWTESPRERFNVLQFDEILAVEPGGRELEKMRHKQFAAIRIYRNREWFTLADDLRSHCKMLVEHFGPPQKLLGWVEA